MIPRIVGGTKKDKNGNITHLQYVNKGKYSEVSIEVAISQINAKTHGYIITRGQKTSHITVVNDNPSYLKSSPDNTILNNLDELPEYFIV